jgi:hypothetical protein
MCSKRTFTKMIILPAHDLFENDIRIVRGMLMKFEVWEFGLKSNKNKGQFT